MITVKLQGGLGNQMFQYAVAKTLAIKNNSGVQLDVSDYNIRNSNEKFTARKYELNQLSINAKLRHQPFLNNSLLKRIRNKFIGQKFYFEKGLMHDSNVLSLKGSIYLEGYFQNEIYFSEIRELLLKEFSSSLSNNMDFITKRSEMQEKYSVAVHIRRGDYSSNSYINSVHGTCSKEYYLEAFDYLENKFGNIRYYFFSDDLNWSLNHLAGKREIIPVHFNSPDSHILEMQLMREAHSLIIANSSFSWWGAWLNNNPEKIVIAPRNWFVDPVKNMQSTQIVPQPWIRL